jgi:hypothetical protein
MVDILLDELAPELYNGVVERAPLPGDVARMRSDDPVSITTL